jgi:iron complex outermembrane receptor protein
MKKNNLLSIGILVLFTLNVFAQKTTKGKVVEKASGEGLPGVSIVIKGSTSGSSTDFDGNFELSTKEGDVLVFSYVGFKTVEIAATTELLIQLENSAESLDEIVIVGYGAVRKKDATGSVTSISSKSFNKTPVVGAEQLLQGKVPGLKITSAGGQPDAKPNIRIRGGSSLSANNNPLIIIDGIPIDNTNPAGIQNPLSLVNPNDIENFSILKDASATAIYGSRASNGVIIITTKRGTTGAPKFNFSSNVSINQVSKKIDLMNGNEFVGFIQQYHPTLTNSLGIDDPETSAVDDLNTPEIEGRILSNTDWQDAIYRTAISTNENFSVRANLFNSLPTRFSVGHTNSEGLVRTSDYERYTASLKLTPKFLNDRLKVDINAKGIVAEKNSIDEGGALGGAVNMDPTKPVYDHSATNRFGQYYQSTVVDGNFLKLDGQSNPLALLQQRSRPEEVNKLIGNIKLDYTTEFLPELKAVLNLGIETSKAKINEVFSDNSLATYRFDQNNPDINTNYLFNPGSNYSENQTMTNKTLDAYLMYTKELDGFLTKFDIQGGYSYQNFENDGTKEEYRYNETTGEREKIVDTNNPTNRYYNVLNLQSYFGRSNLNFADKYLVTFSIRADGSSLFTEENRWGYFPAAAVAWKLSEENFIKNIDFINTLKLRLGWGKTGQQDITGLSGFYPSTPLFEIGSTTSQYLTGYNVYSAKAFNKDLTWEKATTLNIGIDYELFNNKLTGSFDIFNRTTSDLLAQTPVAPGQGLTDRFIQNVGETSSKGFELAFNVNVINNEDFTFDVNTNLAYNKTTVDNLETDSQIVSSDAGIPTGTGVSIAYNKAGYQPHSAWVFKQVYDNSGNPVWGAYADLEKDGKIDNDDRYYKALRPNWTYGFGLNFTYKNWDLNSTFRGQIGGVVYNTRRLTSGYIDNAIPNNSNTLSNVLDFNNGAANSNIINVNGNTPFSDYYLEDASFLRCENIVLGYNFNKIFKETSLRVYTSASNLFIITDYSGQDPENFNGIDDNFYPRPTTYTLGLNFDF